MTMQTTTTTTTAPTVDTTRAVKVTYTNWRGETAERTIVPAKIWWGATEWHTQEQWLLDVWDVEKGENRTYAMKDITTWHWDKK